MLLFLLPPAINSGAAVLGTPEIVSVFQLDRKAHRAFPEWWWW